MFAEIRALVRLRPTIKRFKEILSMKPTMTKGVIGMLAVTAIEGVNSVTDLLPPKYKFHAFAAVTFLSWVIYLMAHTSNPDGTPAQQPWKMSPEELARYRKYFDSGAAVIITLAIMSLTAEAQVLPDHFGAAGMGFQSAASPQASGWAAVCLKTTDRVYTCGATDYAAGSSSARAEIDTALISAGPLTVFAKGGAGAATGSGGVGGSFSGGGVATLDLSKWVKIAQGLHAVASITFTKNDVSVAGQPFGGQSVFRFGFGRAF